jgi:aminoglycoside phosphotransferase (APT) family kinase protein
MESALETYLASHLPGAPGVTVSNLFRIPGGASRETWMFDAAWSENGEPRSAPFIVRKDPPGSLVESDREVEYAFYSAFGGHPIVPVPGMRWLEKDPQHLGAPFFIMDRILGCEANPRLIQTQPYDGSRPALAKRFYEILAAIATSDEAVASVSKLVPVPMPETAWSHELDYWEGMIDANEMGPQPIARAAIRWLRANPPPPAQRVSAVHGDYRVGNFLYRPDGIYGVVDWEMAHLGDPLEDLAWSFHELWEWGRPGQKGGIIPASDAIAIFEHASGLHVAPEALHWWEVFSGVKAQGIWLTGARSFQDGKSREVMLAQTSWSLINRTDEILLRLLGRAP